MRTLNNRRQLNGHSINTSEAINHVAPSNRGRGNEGMAFRFFDNGWGGPSFCSLQADVHCRQTQSAAFDAGIHPITPNMPVALCGNWASLKTYSGCYRFGKLLFFVRLTLYITRCRRGDLHLGEANLFQKLRLFSWLSRCARASIYEVAIKNTTGCWMNASMGKIDRPNWESAEDYPDSCCFRKWTR